MPYQSDFFTAKLVEGVYDRMYGATRFAARFAKFFTNGVVVAAAAITDEMEVTAVADTMKTSVDLGYALINGYGVEVTTAEELTHTAADATNPRIDRVILELSLADDVRAIVPKILTGVSAASPAVPALTRNSTVWQISLAQVLIPNNVSSLNTATITDERDDDAVCGISNVTVVLANVVSKTGGTFTGAVTFEAATTGTSALFSSSVEALKFLQSTANYGEPNEFGKYIDMHDATSVLDFDVRILVEGGFLLLGNPNGGGVGRSQYGVILTRPAIIGQATDLTIDLSHAEARIFCENNESDMTITVPTNASVAFPIGTSIDIFRTRATEVTIAGASGVNIYSVSSYKKILEAFTAVSLIKVDADGWVLVGALKS